MSGVMGPEIIDFTHIFSIRSVFLVIIVKLN